MGLVVVWGWICALVGMFGSLPQVARLLRAGTSSGVSLLMWQLLLGAGIGWTAHGINVGHPNIIVPNVTGAVFAACVLVMLQRDRRLPTVKVWPWGLVVGVIMIGVELVAPPGWFGVLAVIPAAVGMIGQTRDLIRAPDITGLSGGYIIIAVVIQVMWLSWGAAVGDLSTQICSTAIGLIGVVNLALWLTRIKNAEPVVAIVPEDAVV